MTSVFLSSHPADQPRVRPIVDHLRGQRLAVSWDAELRHRPGWRRAVAAELETAGCVVVVWSAAVLGEGGELVLDVAARARERGVLVAVALDEVEPPMGFRDVPVRDLTGWKGRPQNRRFKDLLADVRAVLAGKPRGERPQRSLWKPWLAKWGTAFAAVAAVTGFLADGFGIQAIACRAPGLRAICAAANLGGVPSPEEERFWAARPPGDCEILRAYLARWPRGAYADEVARKLSAAVPEPEERWEPTTIEPEIYVPRGTRPWPDEPAARADALERARRHADDACAGFAHGEHRLRGVDFEVREWSCTTRDRGTVCGFSGKAICQVEVRRIFERQVCP